MLKLHVALIGGVLALILSCNSANKVSQTQVQKGETERATADAETPIASEIGAPPPEPAPQDRSEKMPGPPPPPPKPMEEEDDQDQVALEPVAVGGAFLTCRYQNTQAQGSESYRMDCEVAPALEVKTAIASAAFYKLDTQGNRSLLTILSQDLLALKWTVQENFATVPHNRIQVVLSATGLLSTSLTATVSTPLSLARNAAYWLGGEPNNTVLAGEDEDCVEFANAAMKVSHQNTSGLTTGPLGRMNDIACSTRYNFLCRNVSAGATAAKWVISTFMGTWSQSSQACSAGYAFGFPLSETDVREVNTLVDRNNRAQNIWVNLSDQLKENEFLANFR